MEKKTYRKYYATMQEAIDNKRPGENYFHCSDKHKYYVIREIDEVETNLKGNILELKWKGLGLRKRIIVGLGLIFNGNISIKWKEARYNFANGGKDGE